MLDDTNRLLAYLRSRQRCSTAQLEAALNLSEACVLLAAKSELFARADGELRLTPAGEHAAASIG